MKSNITLEVFESIVIEQLKERGYNTKIVETPGKLGSEHRLIKTPCKDGLAAAIRIEEIYYDYVKIPHTQGYVACNTHRSGYLKPTQPSRLGLPLALWFVRIQARRHLCSHNSTWKTFRVAAASGHLTGTAYGQAVKP